MSPAAATELLLCVFPDSPAWRHLAARPAWRLATRFWLQLPRVVARLLLSAALARLRHWHALLAATPRGANLYVALSLQQVRALQPVWSLDPDAVAVLKRSGSGKPFMSRAVASAFALPALPLLPRLFHGGSPRLRAILAAKPGNACVAIGYDAAWRRLLADLRPGAIVVCNDTAVPTRTALAVARSAGLVAVYLQHGCVTPASPPLATDYALLDGEHSRSAYRIEPSARTQISLIGLARLGRARPRAANGARRRIAVCTGHLADGGAVLETLHAVVAAAPEAEVVLRLHPHQYRRWRVRRRYRGWTLSDAVAQPATDFLHTVDAVIAGNSSILLEAAILGVAPLFYGRLDAQPSWGLRLGALDRSRVDAADFYGFVANGLCPTAATRHELQDWLRDTPPPREDALRRYCDTVGGPYDGRSHELALECIRRAARREPLPLRWDSGAGAPASRATG